MPAPAPNEKAARALERDGRHVGTTYKEQPMSSTQARQRAIILPPLAGALAPRPASNGILEEGRLTVTPEMASQILEKFQYDKQRRIDVPHVDALVYEMQSGVWTSGSQIAFAAMPDGRMILVNGYHRLHAVVKAARAIEFQVLIEPAATADEVDALYYRLDTVQRRRSNRMVLHALGLAEKLGISKDTIVGAYDAGAIIANGLKIVHSSQRSAKQLTPDGKLSEIEKWWAEVKTYDEIITKPRLPHARRLRLPSVMAVALVTLKYQPAKAKEFWTGIVEDNCLAQGDPRKVMINALLTGAKSDRPGDLMIYTANCWNAFFAGRTQAHTKAYTTSVCAPLGTPFSGIKRDLK